MAFTHPWYLLLFIPVVAGLVFSFRHVGGMMRGRKKLAFVLRFLLVGSIVIALAGPESRRPNEGLSTLFLLDRSDSVGDEDRAKQIQFLNEALKGLGPKDEAGVIAFGKEAVVEASSGKLPRLDRVLSLVDGSASDLAAAVRLATASFPDGKARRIVILSDGNETSGDAAEAASVAATDGIPIDTVVLGDRPRTGETAIVHTELPSEVAIDQPFSIKVTIEATARQAAQLDLDRDGVTIKKVPVTLAPGRNTYILSDTLSGTGFHRYRVTLNANGDRDNRNNVGMGFVAVRGRPRILIVQGKPERQELANALRQQNLQVEVRGPGGVPVRPEEFQNYDVVVLNDLNAAGVTPNQQKLIQSSVRDAGVGLAMVGGEDSFLPGGWYGTPVEESLPVDLDIRQRKSFPSTTILIICDTSGSMGMIEDGQPKVRLAAKAAEQTVNMMSALDKVGVVASTDGIEFVAPIQKLTNKPAVIDQIRKLGVGGGGIYCEPSMQFAKKHLMADGSKVRHLILLGDGSDCDLQEGCESIAAYMLANKITTTCVSIGEGPHSPFLKRLALVGGGRYYLATKASQLPAIFTQDAAVMSRSAIEEGAFFPKVAFGEEILRGVDTDGMPALLAYCLTEARPLARVGMRTKKDDPLLAVWQYGLGSSLAFTSDAQPRWAAQWMQWGGFGQFWAQAMRSVARRASANTYQVAVNPSGGQGVVEIDARDPQGNPINEVPKETRVALPNGEFKEIALSQIGPGKFRGAFPTSNVGSYIVTVAESDPRGGNRVSSAGFSVPYPAEYRNYRANRPLLERLSKETKGEVLANPLQASRPVLEPGHSIQELWSFFVLLAALLLPLDVAARRIALPVAEVYAKAVAWLRNRKSTAEAVPAHVERLHAAKKRAATDAPSPQPVPASAVQEAGSASERAPVSPSSASAASSLLEAKRKRQRGESSD